MTEQEYIYVRDLSNVLRVEMTAAATKSASQPSRNTLSLSSFRRSYSFRPMNDRQEIAEGLHTIVVDKSVLAADDPTTLFVVPVGYYVRFAGPPAMLSTGNVGVQVMVEKALPNGCRP